MKWKINSRCLGDNELLSILVELFDVIEGVIVLSRDLLGRGCVPNERFVGIELSVVVGVVAVVDDDEDDVWRERVVCWANVLKPLFVYSSEIKSK